MYYVTSLKVISSLTKKDIDQTRSVFQFSAALLDGLPYPNKLPQG